MIESFSSRESAEHPQTVLDYLYRKHLTLVKGYKNENDQHSAHCGIIAAEIALLLLKAGKKPYIIEIAEEERKGSFIHRKPLVPKMYEGTGISWGSHQVCCCDGKAFDPLLAEPIDIKNYTQTVFGEEISTQVLIPQEEIEEFTQRIISKKNS